MRRAGRGVQAAWPGDGALARHEHIHLEPRFSDHVPPVIDCDFKLEA